MLKTIRDMSIGAIVAAAVSSAIALQGIPPGTGFQAVDGNWLNGVVSGVNWDYQSGITAAGTTQATATVLTPGNRLLSIDTVPSNTGVALPTCLQGTDILIYNNGANTLTVYPNATNNPITAAQDTINNTTTASQTTHTSKLYYCPKNGVWAAQ